MFLESSQWGSRFRYFSSDVIRNSLVHYRHLTLHAYYLKKNADRVFKNYVFFATTSSKSICIGVLRSIPEGGGACRICQVWMAALGTRISDAIMNALLLDGIFVVRRSRNIFLESLSEFRVVRRFLLTF